MALEKQELRETYVQLLIEAGKKDERIVIVEADLMKAGKTTMFKEVFPERTIDVGVAEANMIGVAAGMAVMGKIPFTHSFTAFATRRCCDQVTLSVAYAKTNVKMMGSDPGVAAELNGGTHMSMEDIAIMRNIPNMVIYEPVDSTQLKQILPQIIEYDGPVYIRLFRKITEAIYEGTNAEFKLGKAHEIQDGKDATIIASGIMVKEAIEASKILEKDGISVRVLNVHTIKPLDIEAISKAAKETGAIVTAENHSVLNGLGGAVSEYLSENYPIPVKRIGVRDHFGEVGEIDFLMEKYGLKSVNIVKAVKEAIELKEKR